MKPSDIRKMISIIFMILSLTMITGCKDKNQSANFIVSLVCNDELIQKEMQIYFNQIFEENLVIMNSQLHEEANMIIGTLEHKLINDAVESGLLNLPEGKNADQGYTIKTIDSTIYLAAKTDQGLLYGLYELLEQYGCYFQINGEIVPEKKPFYVKNLHVTEEPLFKYRGLLPWDNFLCGMSGYNFKDYQLLINRATRMKFNMLQFHFYPGIAFFTEEWDGIPVNPTFVGSPVDVFDTFGSIGEQVFGGSEKFAPAPYVENIGNPRAQAETMQQMMREVLDYAKARGFKTVVGFELMVSNSGDFTYTQKPAEGGGGNNLIDPLNPNNVDLSLQRLRTLMKTYFNSDYYWMWQSEARGYLSRNVGKEEGALEMRKKYAHWAQHSPIWDSAHLAGDIDYAYLFKEVVSKLSPAERGRIATGGWSIEHLFPNIHSDFPEDIIFASLNVFDPWHSLNNQIDSFRIANERHTWMIDWWEFDGEQWFPQFKLSWQEKMYRKCAQYGVESVTLLGWKLSGIEHNVRYLSEYSWNSSLCSEDFLRAYLEKVYGDHWEMLLRTYQKYDEAYRSNPSFGPFPYAPERMYLAMGWCSTPFPKLPVNMKGLEDDTWKEKILGGIDYYIHRHQNLINSDQYTVDTFTQYLKTQHNDTAIMMQNRFKVRILYCESLLSLYKSIKNFDEIARQEGIDIAREKITPDVKKALGKASESIELYSKNIQNRNDLGVVAQMNEQFYKPLNAFYTELKSDQISYAKIDWTAFRLNPTLKIDFQNTDYWKVRDGDIQKEVNVIDGRITLRLTIEQEPSFSSIWILPGEIDLANSGYLDFMVKTKTQEPVALMFQTASGGDYWYAINLVGKQTVHANIDKCGIINDGEWHRVTWDLKKLANDRLNVDKIKNLIIGSWGKRETPAVVEFRDFSIGNINLLD